MRVFLVNEHWSKSQHCNRVKTIRECLAWRTVEVSKAMQNSDHWIVTV